MRVGELWEDVLRCGLGEMNPLALIKTEERVMLALSDRGRLCNFVELAVVEVKLGGNVG